MTNKPQIDTSIKAAARNYTACNSRKIEYIIIHGTGHVAPTKNYALGLKNNQCTGSFHYVVGEGKIYKCIDHHNIAWHIGNPNNVYKVKMSKPKNSNSIGIEMSELNEKTGEVADSTIELTGQLVRYLMDLLDIPESRVLRHYDVLSKPCPTGFLTDTKWKKLKKLLVDPVEEIKNNVDYNKKVIVNCNDTLNVRDKRPTNNKLGNKIDELKNKTEALLGYVYDDWGSIYYIKDNEYRHGFVNVKYLELV